MAAINIKEENVLYLYLKLGRVAVLRHFEFYILKCMNQAISSKKMFTFQNENFFLHFTATDPSYVVLCVYKNQIGRQIMFDKMRKYKKRNISI